METAGGGRSPSIGIIGGGRVGGFASPRDSVLGSGGSPRVVGDRRRGTVARSPRRERLRLARRRRRHRWRRRWRKHGAGEESRRREPRARRGHVLRLRQQSPPLSPWPALPSPRLVRPAAHRRHRRRGRQRGGGSIGGGVVGSTHLQQEAASTTTMGRRHRRSFVAVQCLMVLLLLMPLLTVDLDLHCRRDFLPAFDRTDVRMEQDHMARPRTRTRTRRGG